MAEIQTTLLTDKAFHATMVDPMREPAPEDPRNKCDIWTYVDVIPKDDLQGFAIEDCDVSLVRRTGDDHYDHVLIPTTSANVFLVVVVHLKDDRVYGHHLLNLNQKYGLD